MQPPDLDAVRTSYDAVADNYVATAMGDLAPEPWLRAALDAFVAFDGFADGDNARVGQQRTWQLRWFRHDTREVGEAASWSWFNLPREVLPTVVARAARALRPGGGLLLGTHVGDGDVARTSAYGDVPVRWTTRLYRPEDLVATLESAGLRVDVELRFPPTARQPRPQVVLAATRP